MLTVTLTLCLQLGIKYRYEQEQVDDSNRNFIKTYGCFGKMHCHLGGAKHSVNLEGSLASSVRHAATTALAETRLQFSLVPGMLASTCFFHVYVLGCVCAGLCMCWVIMVQSHCPTATQTMTKMGSIVINSSLCWCLCSMNTSTQFYTTHSFCRRLCRCLCRAV